MAPLRVPVLLQKALHQPRYAVFAGIRMISYHHDIEIDLPTDAISKETMRYAIIIAGDNRYIFVMYFLWFGDD